MQYDFFRDFIEKKKVKITFDTLEKDGNFSGYATLFGALDLSGDVIEAGAFTKSLNRRGSLGIRMLYQHDPHQPIGVWLEVREDRKGLFVEGKLIPGVERALEVFHLMKSGAIDGLSVGFRTIRSKKDNNKVRKILEADLWEISIVTFPMLPEARIDTFKHKHRFFYNILHNKTEEFALSQIRHSIEMFKKRIKYNACSK